MSVTIQILDVDDSRSLSFTEVHQCLVDGLIELPTSE